MWRYIIYIVQIISESLPISSSGQVDVLLRIFNKKNIISDNVMSFLHIPAIFMIVCFFYRRWVVCLRLLLRGSHLIMCNIVYVAIADLCTVLFFLVCRSVGTEGFSIGFGFCITGFILWSTRWLPTQPTKKNWCISSAILLGCVQGVALLPGISRLAITYVAARWIGWSHRHAFEVSFVIEIPLLCAAVCKAIVLHANDLQGLFDIATLLIMGGSTFCALILLYVVDWMGYTKRLWFFSFYLYSIGVVTLFIKWFID
jgi:undecaprenyl pyrophosphate phosphatase UppP